MSYLLERCFLSRNLKHLLRINNQRRDPKDPRKLLWCVGFFEASEFNRVQFDVRALSAATRIVLISITFQSNRAGSIAYELKMLRE